MKKYLSLADLLVIILTFFLFAIAVATKGLTHDLFLEAGVLLVSIKIIMMNYKNIITSKAVLEELHEIKKTITEINKSKE
jgi:hypothetical protein